jgi:hypothetical protein
MRYNPRFVIPYGTKYTPAERSTPMGARRDRLNSRLEKQKLTRRKNAARKAKERARREARRAAKAAAAS